MTLGSAPSRWPGGSRSTPWALSVVCGFAPCAGPIARTDRPSVGRWLTEGVRLVVPCGNRVGGLGRASAADLDEGDEDGRRDPPRQSWPGNKADVQVPG